MTKLTKSLSIFKERTCSVSMVLDTRTNKKNVIEYPLSIRFTINRKFFYYPVGGSYSEKRFSDIWVTWTKSRMIPSAERALLREFAPNNAS